jgi:2-polyprenyl-3-methyl-5-hydroxy-6-metoxy-1,4-benzoquinol methylase
VLRYRLKGLSNRLTGRHGRTRVDAGNVPPPHIEVTPEAVTWAYRLFLGRDPENKETVNEKMRSFSAVSDLRKCLLTSPEFRANNPPMHVPSISGHEPAMEVEEVESSEDLAKILEHIRLTWQFHGETEPHWSVLTSQRFLKSHINETEEEFFNSGRDNVEKLRASLRRNGLDPSAHRTCVEYGCGLGRITRWLADRFEHVYCYDISAAHLAGAAHHLTRSGVTNVTLHHVRTVDEMVNLERADLVYSLIVLQHNPPPVIRLIVRAFLKALNPGGVAYFQVPTYRDGYRFSPGEYLENEAKKHVIMEMHVLPQRVIFQTAREEGCELVEVLEDGSTGLRFGEVSNTFLIRKTA